MISLLLQGLNTYTMDMTDLSLLEICSSLHTLLPILSVALIPTLISLNRVCLSSSHLNVLSLSQLAVKPALCLSSRSLQLI